MEFENKLLQYSDELSRAIEKAGKYAEFVKDGGEVGVDVFQSSEVQFMMVKSGKDLRNLGLGAVHRAIYR